MIIISYTKRLLNDQLVRHKLWIEAEESVSSKDKLFGDLLAAIASNSVGDGTIIEELFGDIAYPKGDVLQANIKWQDGKTGCIHPGDFSQLAGIPRFYVNYNGNPMGDPNAPDQFTVKTDGDRWLLSYHRKSTQATSVFVNI